MLSSAFFALARVGSGSLAGQTMFVLAQRSAFTPLAATSACWSVASTLPTSSASRRRRASIFSAHSTVWLSDARPSLSDRVPWRSYWPTAT